MKDPARPSKPNYGSGYDQKKGDQFGERDGHGGYVPDDKKVKEQPADKKNYNKGYGGDAGTER